MRGFEITTERQKKNADNRIGLTVYMLVLYAAAVSFWCALLSVFPIDVEPVVVYGGQMIPVLLWSLVLRIKRGKKSAVLILLCLCGVFGYLASTLLADGCSHMVNTYISLRNVFYATSQPLLEETGSAAGRGMAVFLVQMVLTGILAAVLHARRGALAALGVIVLPYLLAATVGYMPSLPGGWAVIGSGLLYFLVYAQTDKKLLKREIFAAGCVFAVIVGAATLIQPQIVKLRESNKDAYKDIYNRLVDAQQVELGNMLTEAFGGNANYSVGGVGKGDLRNLAENRPQGTKDMEVVVNKAPQERVYLKAYVGSEYTGKRWEEPSEREFNRMLRDAGASGKAEELFGEPYERLKNGQSGIVPLEMDVKLLGASGEFAYSPYFAEVTDEDTVYADAYIKGRGERQRNYSYYQQLEVGFLHTGALGGGTDIWSSYQDYVESTYTKSVDGLERLREYCSDIDSLSRERVTLAIDSKFIHNLKYTREPGAYPSGEDFAEYFLTESRQGFCVHFATAATLIYRECGYPARYVEGYAVPPSAFERQEDGTYKAVVTDRMAHAWCETFDANVGWEVQEHTLPFSADSNWTTEPLETEEPENTEPEETPQTGTDQPEEDAPEEAENNQPEENQPEPEAEASENQEEDRLNILTGGDEGAGGGSGTAIINSSLLKIIAGGALCIGVIVVLAVLCIAQQKIRMQKKKYQFRQKAHNRGIKCIFREIHSIAVFMGLKDTELNDSETLKQMQVDFPALTEGEWSWLYDCALRAAFAEGQLEKAEQQKMYSLYNKFRQAILADLTAKQKFSFIYVKGL